MLRRECSILRPTQFIFAGLTIVIFVLPFMYFNYRSVYPLTYSNSFLNETPSEAYMTLYCPPTPHPWTEGKIDYYFEGTRIMVHNMLYKESTRDPHRRPFIVLVTDSVLPEQIEILEREGAKVQQVLTLLPPPIINMTVIDPRWKDQFTKLRIWNMTEYSRILYMDCDVLPIRPLSSVFDTPMSIDSDGDAWLFAAVYDSAWLRQWGNSDEPVAQPGPDDKDGADSFNAGMFLLHPNPKQANYIESLYYNPPEGLKYECCMEQDLLRFAYRDAGPFRWIRLSHMYNTQWPRLEDMHTSHALHGKLWDDSAPTPWSVRRHWFVAWGEMRGWNENRLGATANHMR